VGVAANISISIFRASGISSHTRRRDGDLSCPGCAHRGTRSSGRCWRRRRCRRRCWCRNTAARTGDPHRRAADLVRDACLGRIRGNGSSSNNVLREGRAERLGGFETAGDLRRPHGPQTVVGIAISRCQGGEGEDGEGAFHCRNGTSDSSIPGCLPREKNAKAKAKAKSPTWARRGERQHLSLYEFDSPSPALPPSLEQAARIVLCRTIFVLLFVLFVSGRPWLEKLHGPSVYGQGRVHRTSHIAHCNLGAPRERYVGRPDVINGGYMHPLCL
jgi:hypothetical protein